MLISELNKTKDRITALEKELRALRCYVGELPHEYTASNRYNNTPVTYCINCGTDAQTEINKQITDRE